MKTKIILNAVLPLVVSILLFFLVGVIGISKISELVLEVKSARNDQTTLSQKLSLLSTFSETTSTGIDVYGYKCSP